MKMNKFLTETMLRLANLKIIKRTTIRNTRLFEILGHTRFREYDLFMNYLNNGIYHICFDCIKEMSPWVYPPKTYV